MKQIRNRKNFLKATLAISSFILAGCAGQTSENTDFYAYDASPVEDVTSLQKEPAVTEKAKNSETCIIIKSEEEALVYIKNQKPTSVAASSPAEPRVVPVKPSHIQSTAKKNVSETTKGAAAGAAVKQKPTTDNALQQKKDEELARIRAEQDRLAAEKAEQDRLAAQKAEQDRLAAEAAEKAKQDKLAAEKAQQDKLAAQKAEQDRLAAEAAQKAKQDKLAAEKAQQDKLAAQKAEQDRLAAEAAQKAKQDKLAAEKAEQERLQKELKELRAQKEALEEERARIAEAKVSKTETCEDVKDWVATEGATLRSLLMNWGDRVGWRVVWNMDRDYTLEAGAVFRGRFVDVAAALLRSFARATPAPKGVFYKGNKVLVVSTREDENAD